ncbi:MAG: PepSY domain-containing protein [Hyphomonadaceae bacterium]
MMRIALSVLAFTAIGAPLIGASMAGPAAPRVATEEALSTSASVAVSQAQAMDIAEDRGIAEIGAVTLSNGDWSVRGLGDDGRALIVNISAATGDVSTMSFDAS